MFDTYIRSNLFCDGIDPNIFKHLNRGGGVALLA